MFRTTPIYRDEAIEVLYEVDGITSRLGCLMEQNADGIDHRQQMLANKWTAYRQPRQ